MVTKEKVGTTLYGCPIKKMENILEVKNLKVEYHTAVKTSYALKGVSFEMKKGEILGIVGESGSGKSTLGMALTALLPATATYSGEVSFKGTDLVPLSFDELRKIKGKEMSVVFQEPMTSLNPLIKVGRQVEEILAIHDPKMDKAVKKDKVLRMFKNVDLPEPEKIYHKYPFELSGGQQQRVVIAMALMNHPDLVIADEPTTALDADVQEEILELFKNINKHFGTSIIIVSHDLRVIRKICDRTLVMYGGEIVEEGTVEQIFENPKEAYTKSLIDAIVQDKKVLDKIKGEPVLEVKDLTLFYMKKSSIPGKKPEKKVICEGLTFDIKDGEILGLVGKSGSGKSSVSRAILGLHTDYTGEIIHHTERPQMIFQDSAASLNPARKVGWILEEPLKVRSKLAEKAGDKAGIMTPRERKQRVLEMLDKVELSETYLDQYPRQLSGGQKQRVNIALALIGGPKFVIADEPVSALDVSIQEQIIELLLNLQKEFELSMLFISHDKAVVDRVCDRVIHLEDWTPKN